MSCKSANNESKPAAAHQPQTLATTSQACIFFFFPAPRNRFGSGELLLLAKWTAILSFFMHCRHHFICFPVSSICCSVSDGGQVFMLRRTKGSWLSWLPCPTLQLRRKPGYLCLFISSPKHELAVCCSTTGYEFKTG